MELSRRGEWKIVRARDDDTKKTVSSLTQQDKCTSELIGTEVHAQGLHRSALEGIPVLRWGSRPSLPTPIKKLPLICNHCQRKSYFLQGSLTGYTNHKGRLWDQQEMANKKWTQRHFWVFFGGGLYCFVVAFLFFLTLLILYLYVMVYNFDFLWALCMCMSEFLMFFLTLFLFFLLVCSVLFLSFILLVCFLRERKKAWGWKGAEVGRIWRKWGRWKRDQNIFQENNFIFN